MKTLEQLKQEMEAAKAARAAFVKWQEALEKSCSD